MQHTAHIHPGPPVQVGCRWAGGSCVPYSGEARRGGAPPPRSVCNELSDTYFSAPLGCRRLRRLAAAVLRTVAGMEAGVGGSSGAQAAAQRGGAAADS